jgi:hypothetical protein
LNRVPTKNKEITPFEEWFKKKVNLSYLCTWGCLAMVNAPINKKCKLGPKTIDCIFLGYAMNNVGYRLIVKSGVSDMEVGTIFESKDGTFFDTNFPMKNIPSTSGHDSVIPHEHIILIEQIEEPHAYNPEEDDNVVTRKSKRKRTTKSFGNDFIVYLMDDTPRTIEEAFSLLILTCGRKQ